jgi:flagellar biosynthesis protein FlhB
MSTSPSPEKETKDRKAGNKARSSAIPTFLLFFCLLFSLRFWVLLFHEGGHALACSISGAHSRILYAHPFTFSGYALPGADRVICHAGGPVIGVLVPLLIFILLWKHRSVALLPLVMVFPWVAMEQAANVLQIMQQGDFHQIIRLTGLPEAVIVIPCLALFIIGVFFFLLLMPLLGLGTKDWRVLIVLPAAVILWIGVSIVVARLVVPGSPIDIVYHEGTSVIQGALDGIGVFDVRLVLLLGVIYLTLYRLIYPRLPSWLKSETVLLTWNDLRIPGLLAVACVIVGLILIH